MAEAASAIGIRAETPGDESAIDALNRLAFGGPEESLIVARLRDAKLVTLSLVADHRGRILGHILFSRLSVTIDCRNPPTAALAPMAVHPDWQRRGIGSRLVRQGLERLPALGIGAVIVLGHPDFYPRFGFSAALATPLDAPFSGDAFMALELKPGALHGRKGSVTYPPAFGLDR